MNRKPDAVRMTYKVRLVRSEEGYAVSCPTLPGCHSQGDTEEEALANIREAIHLWLEVRDEEEADCEILERNVAV